MSEDRNEGVPSEQASARASARSSRVSDNRPLFADYYDETCLSYDGDDDEKVHCDKAQYGRDLLAFIELYNIYHINLKEYFYLEIYKEKNFKGHYEEVYEWRRLTSTQLRRHRMLSASKFGRGCFEAFNEVISDTKRNRNSVFISARPESDDHPAKLNLFIKKNWLAPRDHKIQVHPFLTNLMRSISNGDPVIERHIASVVLRKLKFPGEFDIPAICWYGEGDVGKGLFVQNVLTTIFDRQVVRDSYVRLFGQFNKLMMNKVVVFVDECVASKQRTDKLKEIVGNPDYSIEIKSEDAVSVESLALFFLANNVNDPPIILDKRGDRRWSIVRLDRKIEYYLADEVLREGCANYKNYISKNIGILSDWRQLEQMLWNYSLELPDVNNEHIKVDPYHGPEYDQYFLRQPKREPDSFLNKFFDAVFMSEALSIIDRDNLWEFYLDCKKEFRASGVNDKSTFGKKVKEYMDGLKNDRKCRWIRVPMGSGYYKWVNRFGAPLEKKHIDSSGARQRVTGNVFRKSYKRTKHGWPYSLDVLIDLAERNKIITANATAKNRVFVRAFNKSTVISDYRSFV